MARHERLAGCGADMTHLTARREEIGEEKIVLETEKRDKEKTSNADDRGKNDGNNPSVWNRKKKMGKK